MNLVLLSHNKCAFVDREDWKWLRQWKWSYDTTTGYAYRRQHLPSTRKNQKCIKIYMHRLLNQTPVGVVTDHINRNKLDNQRCNLRSATHSLNHINRGKPKNNTSGYKGISWTKRDKAWIACLNIGGVCKFKAQFRNLEDAVKARKEAERTYHAA